MESNSWTFNTGHRVAKDGNWFIAYVASLIVATAVGIFAWINTSPLFHRAISDARFMNNPHSCEPGHSGRRLLDDIDVDMIEEFWRVAAGAIVGSLVPAAIAGFGIIHLFRKAPQTMVTIGLAMPMVAFAALAVQVSVAGMPQIAPIYLIPVIILAIIIFRHRSMLKLVGRLMKVASDSLAANPTLVPFALGANCAVIPPLIALGAVVYFLQGNGDLAMNPDVSQSTSVGCFEENGIRTSCCVWRPAAWVWPVQIVIVIISLWTEALAAQIRTYVMGGVITQWYFHGQTLGTIPRSLRHALGPARGTLCLSAAVITVCNMIRALADRIRNQRGNPVYLVIGCLFSWLLDLIQEAIRFVSTLATIQAAATGEAFMDAARSVGSLLTRHSLSAVTVWWMPNFVAGSLLSGIMMIAALAAYNIATAMWKDTHRHDPQQDLDNFGNKGPRSKGVTHLPLHLADAIVLAAVVAYVFIVVTGWLLGFVRSATDVVYVCFARDLDNRAVTRPDVHAVLKDVPAATGAVVVQPDNDMMYGAMEDGNSPTAPLTVPLLQPERDLTAAIEAESPRGPRKDGM